MVWRRFIVPILFFALAGTAYATTCSLSGQVFNVDGTPCANCTITLNPVTQQPLTPGGTTYSSQPVSTQTDANGNMTAIALPQGLIVNVTISENGATFGGYTAIVPFMSSATFTQMNQGISSQSLDVLASSQPAQGPVSLNGQRLADVGCPTTNGDALVDGCNTSIGPVGILGDINFNGYSATNLGGVSLVQQPAPTNITITSACTGTCTTTYSYQATCVNAVGETTASATLTASNSASLSTSNTNTLSWPSMPTGCDGGYNIYGRSGTLHLLTNVPYGTTSWTDNGTVSGSDSYIFNFGSATTYALAMFDLTGANNPTPVNAVSSVAGSNFQPTASSITTTVNNSTQIPVFGLDPNSGALTPPGGFSNVVNVTATTNGNYGIWGGTLNIASSGATGSEIARTVTSEPWSALNIGITPANSATPLTISGTSHASSSSKVGTFTAGDPPGTSAGDLLVACIAYQRGANLVTPTNFNLIGNATFGGTSTQLYCFWTLPSGVNGPTVPTVNTTGIIVQSTASGAVNKIVVAGLANWGATTDSTAALDATSIISSVTYPTTMTVMGCRVTWNSMACTGYPTLAIEDTTASNVLCSSGATASGSTDKAITPSNFSVPAGDVIAYIPTAAGNTCTAGQVSMNMTMHQ